MRSRHYSYTRQTSYKRADHFTARDAWIEGYVKEITKAGLGDFTTYDRDLAHHFWQEGMSVFEAVLELAKMKGDSNEQLER